MFFGRTSQLGELTELVRDLRFRFDVDFGKHPQQHGLRRADFAPDRAAGTATEGLRPVLGIQGLNPETGQAARQDRYRLRDNYTRFYLRYIEPREAEIKAGLVQTAPLETLPGWETILGLQFENLVLNQVTELLPRIGFGGLPVLSAAPWRTRGKGKGDGVQIDLLVQTRKSVCVVEIKRRKHIGEEVEAEVDRKVKALRIRSGVSVRTARLSMKGNWPPWFEGTDTSTPSFRLPRSLVWSEAFAAGDDRPSRFVRIVASTAPFAAGDPMPEGGR